MINLQQNKHDLPKYKIDWIMLDQTYKVIGSSDVALDDIAIINKVNTIEYMNLDTNGYYEVLYNKHWNIGELLKDLTKLMKYLQANMYIQSITPNEYRQFMHLKGICSEIDVFTYKEDDELNTELCEPIRKHFELMFGFDFSKEEYADELAKRKLHFFNSIHIDDNLSYYLGLHNLNIIKDGLSSFFISKFKKYTIQAQYHLIINDGQNKVLTHEDFQIDCFAEITDKKQLSIFDKNIAQNLGNSIQISTKENTKSQLFKMNVFNLGICGYWLNDEKLSKKQKVIIRDALKHHDTIFLMRKSKNFNQKNNELLLKAINDYERKQPSV